MWAAAICCGLLASVTTGCGSSHPAAAPAPPPAPKAKVKVKQRTPLPMHVTRPKAKPTLKPQPRVKKKNKQPQPQQQVYTRAWRQNGISEVAYARTRVGVYASPQAKRPRLVLPKRDDNGTPMSFLVRKLRPGWLHVYLPTRPNGSMGWVRRDAVKLYDDRYLVVINVRHRELKLLHGHELVARYPVAVGTQGTPTPRGLFYVVELLQPSNPGGSYGPYSFGLSAHSNVLRTFAGGDGRVGLHGTDQPELIGSSISHGCIRVRNDSIRRLAKILPLGTPVYIRS